MTRILQNAAIAASLLVSTTTAAISTYSPLSSSEGPSYSIGLPSSSISATSTGPIYIQVKAPSTYTWAAFGIGEQMAGSRIFVVYADGNGNVTVSARKGVGNVQPLNDASLQGGVQLLAGSGVVDGEMRANIRVSSSLNSGASSTESPFIAAWMPGSPLNSASLSASLRQHSGNAYRQFTFDLSRATLTSDTNPFISSSTSPQNPDSSSSPDTNTGSGAKESGTSNETLMTYQKAHGIIMSVAMVLLFPLGAVFMRMGGSMFGHAGLQLGSLISMTVGFGLGIKLGDIKNLLFNTTHTILGTTLFGLFLIQPLLGLAHHLLFLRLSRRTPVSHVHIWYGRIIMALGIVNGGLGLRLANNSKTGEIVYGIVAGVVALGYASVVYWKRGKGVNGRSVKVEEGREGVRLESRGVKRYNA